MENGDAKSGPSEKDVLIKNEGLMPGVFAALNHSQTFLHQSKTLYDGRKFQTSIPLATISLEESLKGIELATRFRRGLDVTRGDWVKLKSHKYKLTHVTTDAKSVMAKSTEEEGAMVWKELEEGGISAPKIAKEKLMEMLRDETGIYSHFQALRESCFYSDWSETESEWKIFPELPEDKQQALAFYVLSEAESKLDFLQFTIEKIVNALREKGQLTDTTLSYPPYKEHRDMKQFESVKKWNNVPAMVDKVRYDQGRLVMQKSMTLPSFESVSLGIFSDTMLKCLKTIQKNNNLSLHPMVKAMLIALDAGRNEGKDGNYMGLSGDADLTPDGKPSMSFTVVVNLASGIYTFKEIDYFSDKKYILDNDLVEKILRTEMVLERKGDPDIPTSTYIEALSVIGVRAKEIKETEIQAAIDLVRSYAQKGGLVGIPPAIFDEIRKCRGREDWDSVSSPARALIVTTYGSSQYRDYDLFLTPTNQIPRWKCRSVIMHTLQTHFLDTA